MFFKEKNIRVPEVLLRCGLNKWPLGITKTKIEKKESKWSTLGGVCVLHGPTKTLMRREGNTTTSGSLYQRR